MVKKLTKQVGVDGKKDEEEKQNSSEGEGEDLLEGMEE